MMPQLSKWRPLPPPRAAAPERTALRVVAAAWAGHESGTVVFVSALGAGPQTLVLAGGGLARPDKAAVLDAALGARWARFVPSPPAGPGDRTLVAKRLAEEALQDAPTAPPDGIRHAAVTRATPLALLDEIGLYPQLRWEVSGREPFAELDFRGRVAVQLHGLRRLGWLHPEVNPPPQEPPPVDYYTIAFHDPGEPDASFLDVLFASEGPAPDDQIGLATAHLSAGRWQEADALLTRLRDRRIDDPHVLALLAWARVGDPRVATPARVAEASRWAGLARALGGGGREVDAALVAFDTACAALRGG